MNTTLYMEYASPDIQLINAYSGWVLAASSQPKKHIHIQGNHID